MMGWIRLLISAGLGAVLFACLPVKGVANASQELIGFLSLLMAGILPAMVLTTTVLKGEGLSAKRVDEYNLALTTQLRFWAVLFAFAALATATIVALKILQASTFAQVSIRRFELTKDHLEQGLTCLLGAFLAVLVQRLGRAYSGLVALLQLNSDYARKQAVDTDLARAEALLAQVKAARPPQEYRGKGSAAA